MKKTVFLFFLIMIFSFSTAGAEPTPEPTLAPTPAPQQTAPVSVEPVPEIHAGASILMDLKTGRILYENNSEERMYPASTTKVLTGIMAIEMLDPAKVVTATDAAIAPITMEHSSMGIYRGEQLTIEQLIYGMLVHSANDAANVLAIEMGGTLSNFAQMMNEKAAELGAQNSHFVNPHGFHDDDHYTTAKDLALISKYAMQNEKFREIVATTRYTIPPTNKYKTDRILITTNNLISKFKTTANFYDAAIGVKTGSTSLAQYCLVGAAKKGDAEFLTVLMKCPNQAASGETAYSFADTKKLLEYAFNNYEYKTVAAPTDIISDSKVYEAKDNVRVALVPKDEISSLLPKNIDTVNDIVINREIEEDIKAPISKGQVLGKVSFSYNGELLGETELVASNDVEKDQILFIIHTVVSVIKSPFFYIPAALAVIALIAVRIRIVKNRKKHRRNTRMRYR